MARIATTGVLTGLVLAAACGLAPVLAAEPAADEDTIVVEDEESATDAIVVEDEGADAIVVEDEKTGSEAIVVEEEKAESGAIVVEEEKKTEAEAIVVEEEETEKAGGAEESGEIVVEQEPAQGGELQVEQPAPGEEAIVIQEEGAAKPGPEPAAPAAAPAAVAATQGKEAAGLDFRADKLWLEYSPLVHSGEQVDSFGWGDGQFSVSWAGGGHWEARLAGRVDAYLQYGDPKVDEVEADYGESYVRYSTDTLRVTAGTQTVIWGRIDELPPTDRLSVQDLTRFFLDDLQDRRRARPMLRVEGFSGSNKLELLYAPNFRGAELPEEDSIWYPINRRSGEVLGFEKSALLSQVVRGARIDDDAPDSDNAVGLRFSRSEGAIDFALSGSHGRQSAPYFEYVQPANTLEARYPSATTLGGDVGIEAGGVLWRFEAAWISDVPVTREGTFAYDTVQGVNWAAGIEFYPGDGDARVNLQFAAANLDDANDVLDARTDIYNFNGSMEVPFAQDRWRANLRFFAGLDERDLYINPKLTFLGWQPHSFYLQLQYFDGDDGTLGGFHKEHSVVSVGWRAEF